MKAVILAAGIGSRLGKDDLPKTLIQLDDGSSLLGRMVAALQKHQEVSEIAVVVGYRQEAITNAFPRLRALRNPDYATENTAGSLLRAFQDLGPDTLLWLNGDVLFHPNVLAGILNSPRSCMLVRESSGDPEEVNVHLSPEGWIQNVSKEVRNPQGEAIGINLIRKEDYPLLLKGLQKCATSDYFERGIEHAIADGLRIWPVRAERDTCIEIDFEEDLAKANQLIRLWPTAS